MTTLSELFYSLKDKDRDYVTVNGERCKKYCIFNSRSTERYLYYLGFRIEFISNIHRTVDVKIELLMPGDHWRVQKVILKDDLKYVGDHLLNGYIMP